MLKFLELAVPGYKPPNRFKIAREIAKRYKKFRNLLSKRLSLLTNVAFTTDLWKNRKRIHYVSLNAQFLDENFEHLSYVVSFRAFKGRHLSIRIKAFLLSELKKLKIKKEAIVSTTTDNAADIKCATKQDFGLWLSCFCHNLNLTLQAVLNEKKKRRH